MAGWSETEQRKPRENVPQIGDGIQAVAVAAGDETKMNGGGLAPNSDVFRKSDQRTDCCNAGERSVRSRPDACHVHGSSGPINSSNLGLTHQTNLFLA
jgi:hypothetical protein